MKPEPFRIEATLSPRIWGARSLAPLFPEKTNLAEPIGEAWLTDVNCLVSSGPFAGKTLGEAWREMPSEWRGSAHAAPEGFPLLLKFIFPRDKLSIQVHPDDAYASVHEKAAGGRGKTEMWHAVSADPGAQVLVGLKPGLTREGLLEALSKGSVEECFLAHAVAAGDTFFVPAGTPHTIGPGMVLCEVQQYCDLTYRVYDYGRVDSQGRPRELHVEKALAVMNFGPSPGGRIEPVPLPLGRERRDLLAACRYFAAERWDLVATAQATHSAARFELFVVLEGIGYIHGAGAPKMYQCGQCWFIPGALDDYSVQPEQKSALLRTWVPDLAALTEEIQKTGVPANSVRQAVLR